MSGTSVAAPVITGALVLLASVVPEESRWDIMNPASAKQIIMAGATRVPSANIFEQGGGKFNLIASYRALAEYVPHASLFPAALDFTDCPYMWPYCSQPMFVAPPLMFRVLSLSCWQLGPHLPPPRDVLHCRYHTGMPVMANITILNAVAVASELVSGPVWVPGAHGDVLAMRFTHARVVWPWTGYMGIVITVKEDGSAFDGVAEGVVRCTLDSIPAVRVCASVCGFRSVLCARLEMHSSHHETNGWCAGTSTNTRASDPCSGGPNAGSFPASVI